MAETPLGATASSVTHPRTIPRAPAVMAILDRFNRDELGNTIEVLVALLDLWDGEPDDEPGGDDEPLEANGDALDAAYVEWTTKPGNLRRSGNPELLAGQEDDEEDDPAEEDDGDSAVDDGPCDEPLQDLEPDHDAEGEQMGGDVPMLPVFTAEHNIFNDRRTLLGIGNLQSSFVGEARSADTGAMHKGRAPDLRSKPGEPV